MTPVQIAKIGKLAKCSFLPGSFQKRFVRDLEYVSKNSPEKELTEKQVAYLEKLYHRFRRQIPGHEVDCMVCSGHSRDAGVEML